MTNHDAHLLAPSPNEGTTAVLSIGELAQQTGVPIKAIRYYEQIGLLPPPVRESNGYRSYTQADVHRVNLLRRLRFLGTSLASARPLVEATLTAPCQQVQTDLLYLVETRLVELDQEVAALLELRAHMQQCQQRLATAEGAGSTPFALCFDGSCLACSHLHPSEEQAYQGRGKAREIGEE